MSLPFNTTAVYRMIEDKSEMWLSGTEVRRTDFFSHESAVHAVEVFQ